MLSSPQLSPFIPSKSVCVCTHSVVSDSLRPHAPARLLCPWDSPGKDTGVGCHALPQGIFPTQRLNPGLPHCRQILYCLSHQGSPIIDICAPIFLILWAYFLLDLFLLLCFLPRDAPLAFVIQLVWWCKVLLTFVCLESF